MPSYRIVVVEHTASPKAGKFVEKLGTYNPKSKERNLKAERITYWMSVGAKPSGTVHNMLVSAGILNEKKVNVLPKKTVPKKQEDTTAPVAESKEVKPTEATVAPPASVEDSGVAMEVPTE